MMIIISINVYVKSVGSAIKIKSIVKMKWDQAIKTMTMTIIVWIVGSLIE